MSPEARDADRVAAPASELLTPISRQTMTERQNSEIPERKDIP